MQIEAAINVAIVVPCYNEELTIGYLVSSIDKTIKQLPSKYKLEVILVDDGSTDGTEQAIKSLSKDYSYIYYRILSSNAGHQAALRAGLDSATGYEAVIMMDADMQHPPELIPKIITVWEESGANIVQMLRQDGPLETGYFKFYSSKLYYMVLNALSGLNLEYGSSDFRLIDKGVSQALHESIERDLFLRGYFAWLNVKKVRLEYNPGRRIAGSSKYTLKKMLKLAQQSVLQFSEKPLYLAINIGLVTATASFMYGLFLVFDYFVGAGNYVSGWTTIVVVLLFCFGLNFIMLGLIGTYLAHSIRLEKNRPEYIVTDEKLPKISSERDA